MAQESKQEKTEETRLNWASLGETIKEIIVNGADYSLEEISQIVADIYFPGTELNRVNLRYANNLLLMNYTPRSDGRIIFTTRAFSIERHGQEYSVRIYDKAQKEANDCTFLRRLMGAKQNGN